LENEKQLSVGKSKGLDEFKGEGVVDGLEEAEDGPENSDKEGVGDSAAESAEQPAFPAENFKLGVEEVLHNTDDAGKNTHVGNAFIERFKQNFLDADLSFVFAVHYAEKHVLETGLRYVRI
jgi:hypothetical protein